MLNENQFRYNSTLGKKFCNTREKVGFYVQRLL